MYRKRSSRFLPVNRPFRLFNPLGWVVNFFTVAFAIVVLIFYDFPVILPVTGSNMSEYSEQFRLCGGASMTNKSTDYTSAVIGVMAIFAAINWGLHARKSYHGPRLAEF